MTDEKPNDAPEATPEAGAHPQNDSTTSATVPASIDETSVDGAAAEPRAGGWVDQAPSTTSPYLVFRHPGDLLANPHNPRKDYGDLTGLKDTIASVGLVQALTLIPEPGGERILAGWRRATAALEVIEEGRWPNNLPEVVPCLVDPARVGPAAEQLISMVIENDERLGMSMSERANAYAQLELFGMRPEMIAKRLGRTVEVVKTTLKVVKLGDAAIAAADNGQLDLRDVARMETFAADPDATERLRKKIGNAWSLRHQLDEEERRQRDRHAVATLRRELADAGVAVINRPKGWPFDCQAADVITLRTAEGEPVDVDAVKATKGFAGFVETEGAPRAVIVCLDPEGHGYVRRRSTSYRSPEAVEEAQRREAEEAAARETRTERLTDAEQRRDDFMVETWGTAKAIKPLLVEAMRQAVTEPRALEDGEEELIRALVGGGELVDMSTAGADRLTRVMAAMWLAAEAVNLTNVMSANGRTSGGRAALAFIGRLVAAGYALADIEEEVQSTLAADVAADDVRRGLPVLPVGKGIDVPGEPSAAA